MMSVRHFVGNLAYDATEAELREFLSAAGAPLSVRILTDRETGKPRGFGFIEWTDAAQAEEAIRRFHQQVFKGRPLVINEARAREAGTGAGGNAFVPGGRGPAGGPGSAVRAGQPGQPARTFGPDAPPRGKRKPAGRGGKGERGPKGPIPERGGGQFFAGGVDDSPDDQAADDTPFWLRPESDTQTED
jgi:RNA recognition motif-containing protein